ncbi:MAG: AmmeMemoRadiSam system protein A [Thermoprotei archaeon]
MQLVKIARKTIAEKFGLDKLNLEEFSDPILNKKGLAFVTLETYSGTTTSLRGCIGYVEAVAPIKEVVARAAEAAAFSDPRFPPLTRHELDAIIVEVTVLTKPQPIEVENRWELPKTIKVGRDGLIVERGIMYSGLLLPQVPVEYCWDEETFLAETCIKAGLLPDCWLDPKVTVKKFQGIIFRELYPNSGDILVLEPSEVKCKLLEEINQT